MGIEEGTGIGMLSTLEASMEQCSNSANDLRKAAELAHKKAENSQSVGSMTVNFERSRIIIATAKRIEQALSFLGQRLSEIGPDPES